MSKRKSRPDDRTDHLIKDHSSVPDGSGNASHNAKKAALGPNTKR